MFHYYIIILIILDHQLFSVIFLEIYCYLFFGLLLSNSIIFVSISTVSKLFCGELLVTFVILSAISLPIKSLVGSAVFCIAFLKQF